MVDKNTGLETLKDIRQMMERSSRFISLSGLSGIAAGICALVGAWFAYSVIDVGGGYTQTQPGTSFPEVLSIKQVMADPLVVIAMYTLVAAFVGALVFTWLKSKKNNMPIWGASSKRLMWHVAFPLMAGGIFIIRMIQLGYFGLIAPGCLIFYGIALVNASKYTLGEVKYLGYGQTLLGIINCWFLGYGLYFWATGFGLLHIIYGLWMWWRYERGEG